MGQANKRGGSWNNNPRNCRSAYRNYNTPDNRNNNIGFRVVCAVRALFDTRADGWEFIGCVLKSPDLFQ
ncbi:MAG: formylglycine-generating enzyme family protein [Snowella sp.]